MNARSACSITALKPRVLYGRLLWSESMNYTVRMPPLKHFLIFGVLLASVGSGVRAQSLDVGGIQLHIGQQLDEALHVLSPYKVSYIEPSTWMVYQQAGSSLQSLGQIDAAHNAVTRIVKWFDFDDSADAPEVYGRASRELHRLGGSTCTTRIYAHDDEANHIRGFLTRCGAYELSYYMPTKVMNSRTPGQVSLETSAPGTGAQR